MPLRRHCYYFDAAIAYVDAAMRFSLLPLLLSSLMPPDAFRRRCFTITPSFHAAAYATLSLLRYITPALLRYFVAYAATAAEFDATLFRRYFQFY